jgi:AcrR family transcriptional regulator
MDLFSVAFADCQYSNVWKMAQDRLEPADWVRSGLTALEKSGFTALKADTLAKTMGVSRGSFYWHFADVGSYHKAVLNRWREIALERVIDEIDNSSGDKLDILLMRAFEAPRDLEIAIRAWATTDPEVSAAVAAVDAERERYLCTLLMTAGLGRGLAAARARILYWCYLGFTLSPQTAGPSELKELVADLSFIARSKRRSGTPNSTRG